MNDESVFLQRILSKPEDTTIRLDYAKWLKKRGDPRAPFLELDPALERISYVAWLESQGSFDYYLKRFPEVKRDADERLATDPVRLQRRTLGATLDPDWVAFIDTLGCPFEPFFFFNNHGNAREWQPTELPFAEPIGTRGAVITFESDFRDGKACDHGLMQDLRFLSQLKLDECYYGAASCPVHPFICQLKPKTGPLTAADVIFALKVKDFRSEHIQTLEATSIPYPGYHPGTENDEIHNDFTKQKIFRHQGDEEVDNEDDEGDGNTIAESSYEIFVRYVGSQHVWYALLHGEPIAEGGLPRYVVLFAIAQSPFGDRLLGVVTHQVCHNLCD
jgi:uncharacterized protein (TIGR02996 family)